MQDPLGNRWALWTGGHTRGHGSTQLLAADAGAFHAVESRQPGRVFCSPAAGNAIRRHQRGHCNAVLPEGDAHDLADDAPSTPVSVRKITCYMLSSLLFCLEHLLQASHM